MSGGFVLIPDGERPMWCRKDLMMTRGWRRELFWLIFYVLILIVWIILLIFVVVFVWAWEASNSTVGPGLGRIQRPPACRWPNTGHGGKDDR
jgi:hypothetical protein